jgi:hypothetical protein
MMDAAGDREGLRREREPLDEPHRGFLGLAAKRLYGVGLELLARAEIGKGREDEHRQQ